MEKIYLDTSIVSAYFDERIPYQREITRDWWGKAKYSYETFISMVTQAELEQVGEPKRSDFLHFIEEIPILQLVNEVEDIANKYVSAGVIPAKYIGDAFHLAYVTHYKIDYFVTWNCSHFANVNKRRKIRLFNAAAGLFTPEIITPEFFMESEK